MANEPTDADVDTLHDLYAALITQMTYASDTSGAVLAIWKQEATNALHRWAAAMKAVNNLSASAAASYSNGVGMSTSKIASDKKAAEAQNNFQAFVNFLLKGGITAPSAENNMDLWDLRGVTVA